MGGLVHAWCATPIGRRVETVLKACLYSVYGHPSPSGRRFHIAHRARLHSHRDKRCPSCTIARTTTVQTSIVQAHRNKRPRPIWLANIAANHSSNVSSTAEPRGLVASKQWRNSRSLVNDLCEYGRRVQQTCLFSIFLNLMHVLNEDFGKRNSGSGVFFRGTLRWVVAQIEYSKPRKIPRKDTPRPLWRTKKSRFQPLVKMGMKTVDKNIDKKNKQ